MREKGLVEDSSVGGGCGSGKEWCNEEEECEGEGGAAHCAVLCLCWVLFSLLC